MSQNKFNTFIQDGPHLGNQFLEDSALIDYISTLIPSEIINQCKDDLIDLGYKTVTEYYEYHKDAEKNPPNLEQFDAWGNRIDIIHTTWGWKKLHDVSARDGLVAFGYEGKYNEYTRLLQFIRLYLFNPSSGLYNCPLAMTDGATFLIKNILKNDKDLPEKTRKRMEKIYTRLTSRDPNNFWTSGQWMTEKRGGSDVSGSTETIANHIRDNKYSLYGDK